MSLLDPVRRTIRRHEMADARTRVVVAVSGGSDSVALAHIARELADAGELTSPASSISIISCVKPLCATRSAVARWPRDSAGRSSSNARTWRLAQRGRAVARGCRAHVARYAFFARARAQCGADVVALGHTRDDQAETFLLRLLRGAGARGLASMHPRNGFIVRPLLDCRRAALRAYLAERGVPFVEDETNSDVAIARNRVRAELLPILEARFNPDIVETLATEAEIARDEWLWMSESADALRRHVSVMESKGDRVTIAVELDLLATAPPALARDGRLERDDRGGRRPLDFVRPCCRRAASNHERAGRRSTRPGIGWNVSANRLVLTSRPAGNDRPLDARRDTTNLFEYPLSIPGEVLLPRGRLRRFPPSRRARARSERVQWWEGVVRRGTSRSSGATSAAARWQSGTGGLATDFARPGGGRRRNCRTFSSIRR